MIPYGIPDPWDPKKNGIPWDPSWQTSLLFAPDCQTGALPNPVWNGTVQYYV